MSQHRRVPIVASPSGVSEILDAISGLISALHEPLRRNVEVAVPRRVASRSAIQTATTNTMSRRYNMKFQGCLIIILALLAGCSKVTAENYDKVSVGMSYEEVTKILGKPDQCSDAAGFKSCRWGDEKRGVSGRFVAGKLMLHTAENIK